MIKFDIEQGSDTWFKARSGIPTASNFDKIITSTGKRSTQAESYINTLLAEWITQEKTSVKQNEWMERGIELEAEARQFYEFIKDVEVSQTGLVYKDDSKMVACSPDGLIDSKGLEIKCPAPHTHIGYMLKGTLPAAYKVQVQGSMWVCDYDTWDFVSYHPDIKPLIITVERDERLSKVFDEVMNDFIEDLLDKRELIKQKMAA